MIDAKQRTPNTLLEGLWTSKQVAAYLQVSEPTLSRWRAFNSGPKFVNLNGIPRYRPDDVRSFVLAQVSQ